MKAQALFKCPWCGTGIKSAKDLDAHAKDHYRNCDL